MCIILPTYPVVTNLDSSITDIPATKHDNQPDVHLASQKQVMYDWSNDEIIYISEPVA